jgi:hypothetical protein
MFGIASLRDALLTQPPDPYFLRESDQRTQQRWSVSEQAVLICNLPPLSLKIPFSWPADKARGTRDYLPPVEEPYLSHSTLEAFSSKCWHSTPAAEGDFYGFELLTPVKTTAITLCGSTPFQRALSATVNYNTPCKFDRVDNCIRVLVPPQVSNVSAVILTAQKDFKGIFSLCNGPKPE